MSFGIAGIFFATRRSASGITSRIADIRKELGLPELSDNYVLRHVVSISMWVYAFIGLALIVLIIVLICTNPSYKYLTFFS